LSQPFRQLGLWDTNNEKAQKLQQAVDELRGKFGKKIIH
jgi:hypothetical protein